LLHSAVERGAHPFVDWMANPSLNVFDHVPCAALVPGPVQLPCNRAELDDEILAQVLGHDFPSLFPPEPNEPRFVVAHDDAGVGAADE
jgi:hypothetical protein